MIKEWLLEENNIIFRIDDKSKDKKSMGMLLLQELLQNGYGSKVSNIIINMPIDGIYSLSNDTNFESYLKELTLPPLYNKKILLKGTKDRLNDSDFKLTSTFHNYLNPPSDNLHLIKNECFLKKVRSMDYSFTLGKAEYELFIAMDKFNNRGFVETNIQYEMYGQLLDLKKRCHNVELENSLSKFYIEIPEKFNLNVELIDNNPQLSLELFNDKDKQDQFNNVSKKLDSKIYPLAFDDERVFVPTTNEQHCEKIKADKLNERLQNGEKFNDVISNPIEIFDTDVINIDENFSERVIGFGLYEPKISVFSNHDGNNWFPEFEISDDFNGTSTISFENKEDLEEFETIVDEAKEANQRVVDFNDRSIPIVTAEEIIEKSHKQFEDSENAIGKERVKKYVLKIKENDEQLEHTENSSVNEIKHILERVPNLNDGIELKEHQKEGVAWLQSLYKNSSSGCLLADDMGLGKTLQVLAFLEWLKSNSEKLTKNLIVAPLSLLENWRNEYEKFFENNDLAYNIIVLDSSKKSYLNHIDKETENWTKDTIVIMNYHTLRANQIMLGMIHWDAIILDEAQQIKTPGTMITNAAKALNGDFKIAITGTPVENSYQDLWCLMDFTNPGLLGCRLEFNKKFNANLSTDDEYYEMGKTLRENIGDLIKRRDKTILKNILGNKYISSNPKDSSKFYIDVNSLQSDMNGIQLERYKNIINEYHATTDNVAFSTIHKMKSISDHPRYGDKDIVDIVTSSKKKDVNNYSLESARIKSLYPVIDNIQKKKEKIIIFAEYRITQKLLKLFFENRYKLKDITIINGDTPATEGQAKKQELTRQKHIDFFNESKGFNIIIMSPIAAGTGLNVTGANHVIHYSRHWNPAKENQATDRAYRIGQTKDVFVYYPLATAHSYGFDTFDVVVDRLLQKKNTLAGSALFPSKRMAVHQDEIFSELRNFSF